jgi:hypothetical protein
MDKKVKKAKIIMEFAEGVNLTANATLDEALQVFSAMVGDGEVKVKVEYEDGSDAELTREEEEEEEYEDEDDDDDRHTQGERSRSAGSTPRMGGRRRLFAHSGAMCVARATRPRPRLVVVTNSVGRGT